MYGKVKGLSGQSIEDIDILKLIKNIESKAEKSCHKILQ